MSAALALVLLGVTIAAILFRPGHLPEGAYAAAGGGLAVALGLVGPLQAANVVRGTLDVLGFFLGMMTITACAEEAGLFGWAAALAAKMARGSSQGLLLAVFGVGAFITIFLSNDATALVLTPLVLTTATRLKLPALPYAFACAIVANTASTLLPISNPLNVIVLDAFPTPLGTFMRFLGIPTAAVLALAYLLLRLMFRRELSGGFPPAPGLISAATTSRAYFRFSAASLLAIAAAYVAASAVAAPLSLVALSGGALLLVGAALLGVLRLGRIARSISWSIFPFVAGLFVVIQGLQNTGLSRYLGQALLSLARVNTLAAVVGATLLTAIASNLVNNLPVALLTTSALREAGGPAPPLLFGSLLGADVGPCLSITGSLAGMFWLIILRRRGLDLTGWQYLKLGLAITPPLLLVGALVLWSMVLLP